MIKVFLADDHQVLINGVTAVLSVHEQIELVGYSLDGVDLLDKALAAEADILVMDINMPNCDGIAVLKLYSPERHPFKIIILSTYDDLKLIREVFKMGVYGYLTKQSASSELSTAILAVYQGNEYTCQATQDKVLSSFMPKNTNSNSTPTQSYATQLTEREIDIIRLLAMEYTSKEISDELFISTHTVETHRKNLMKKLQVNTTIGLVKYAIKNQLINI